MKKLVALLVLMIVLVSSGAFAFTNDTPYNLKWTGVGAGSYVTKNGVSQWAGAIKIQVSTLGGTLLGVVNTMCVTPKSTLSANSYQSRYWDAMDIKSSGASYLLAHNQISKTDAAFNAGLQAAVWKCTNVADVYTFSSHSANTAGFWYDKFMSDVAANTSWTATTAAGFAGGGVGGIETSQGVALTGVPEPGTILAVLSILGPAGFAFRRRFV